jgi:uncharacterized protein (TIGR00369 family)
MAMTPVDAGFEQRTRDSFARQAAMRLIGATLESVEAGRVAIAFAHRDELTQQHGFVHAGIVGTALDSACGYAGFTLMGADDAVLTIEFKLNLLAPARGPRFRCEGVVLKSGRTITVVEGRAVQLGDDGRANLVATMSATLMALRGRDGLRH